MVRGAPAPLHAQVNSERVMLAAEGLPGCSAQQHGGQSCREESDDLRGDVKIGRRICPDQCTGNHPTLLYRKASQFQEPKKDTRMLQKQTARNQVRAVCFYLNCHQYISIYHLEVGNRVGIVLHDLFQPLHFHNLTI